MASYNFTDFEKSKKGARGGERAKVGYFSSLKEDGDETLVRLNYSTKADFKVTDVHRVMIDGKWKNVECVRGMYDTAEKCPLCASGDKRKSKVFVQLLQYSRGEDGKITAEPKIWDRGYGFVPELLDVIADAVEDEKIKANTPIRDIVFKVRRVGEKGSLDTRYKLKVMQPAVVPETEFTKDFSAFEGFDSAHHDYFTKTEEELKYFVENKKFPEVETKEETKAEEPAFPGVEEYTEVFENPAPVKEEKPVVNRYNW